MHRVHLVQCPRRFRRAKKAPFSIFLHCGQPFNLPLLVCEITRRPRPGCFFACRVQCCLRSQFCHVQRVFISDRRRYAPFNMVSRIGLTHSQTTRMSSVSLIPVRGGKNSSRLKTTYQTKATNAATMEACAPLASTSKIVSCCQFISLPLSHILSRRV